MKLSDPRNGLEIEIDPSAVYYAIGAGYGLMTMLPITAPGAAELITLICGVGVDTDWKSDCGPYYKLAPSGVRIEVKTGEEIIRLLKTGAKVAQAEAVTKIDENFKVEPTPVEF